VGSALAPKSQTSAGSAADRVTGPTSAEKLEVTAAEREETASHSADAADPTIVTITAGATLLEALEEVDLEAVVEEMAPKEEEDLKTAEADHLVVKEALQEEETWKAAPSSCAKDVASFARSEDTSRETAPNSEMAVEIIPEGEMMMQEKGDLPMKEEVEIVAYTNSVANEATLPFAMIADVSTLVVGRLNIALKRVAIIRRPARPSVGITIRPALGLLTGATLVKLAAPPHTLELRLA